MTQENKILLLNRVKSFAWRLGGMITVAIIGFILDNIGVFNFNPAMVGVIGLILGEITKWIKVQSNLGKGKKDI